MSLKRQIMGNLSDAVVEGVEGRRRTFEVKVNDKLVFSKVRVNAFPDVDDVRFEN